MLKQGILIIVVSCVFLKAVVVFGSGATQILYTTTELEPGRWQYDYQVTNVSLGQILEEFTIWFDFELYGNLVLVDAPSLPWEATVWQPDPVSENDGGFNAENAAWGGGIEEGQTLGGFAASFDWLGTGTPGSQFYEVTDFVTSDVIDSGFTVPEPATLCLLGLGVVLLRKKE